MTPEEILALAVRIEKKAGDIYRLLYHRFKDDNMVGYLWYSLALEEDAHADFLEAEMKMMKTVPHAFGNITVDTAPLLDSLKKMEAWEASIMENPVTIETALCFAMQIEDEMVEKKYADLIEIASPSLKRIFKELTAKSDHVERLAAAVRKLGLKCR